MAELLHDLLFDYTVRTVTLGAAALGAVAGGLGTFAVLRRQSLLGDAISHAALPGIALAFLLTGVRASGILLAGAAVAGWIATLLVIGVVRHTRVPEDSALGIVLSVFFGLGLVLLTFVQRRPTAAQAGLETFLFGQAATLVVPDVLTIALLGGVAALVVALLWKEFKLLAFDREYGAALGLPMQRIEVALTTVLVLAIVIGLQAVGVVLMSALVVAPAVAARQWTDSLGVMVWLAALFGAAAGVAGALLSGVAAGIPTGPTVVLSASALVVLSLLLAPRRGLARRWIEQRSAGRQILEDLVLADLLALAEQHPGRAHGHDVGAIEAIRGRRGAVQRALDLLREKGWARRFDDGGWAITPAGAAAARRRQRPGAHASDAPAGAPGDEGGGGGGP